MITNGRSSVTWTHYAYERRTIVADEKRIIARQPLARIENTAMRRREKNEEEESER